MRIKERILAIDPGTRNMGIAVLDGEKLVYYGVKMIRGVKSPHEKLKMGRKIVLELIKDFRPYSLVVEKTFFANNRNSALLNVFSDEIKALGKSKKLSVSCVAANTVRRIVCGDGSASKQEVARILVSRYPELRAYLSSDKRWKEDYHYNMFDAVALGLASFKTN